MSDIPQARAIIALLAENLQMQGLGLQAEAAHEALALMTRRPPARPRAPVRSRIISEADAEQIRDFAHRNPAMALQDIAVMFKTNHGRVSEALLGDR